MPPNTTGAIKDQRGLNSLKKVNADNISAAHMKSSLFTYNRSNSSSSHTMASQQIQDDFFDSTRSSNLNGRKSSYPTPNGGTGSGDGPPPRQIKCVLIGDGAVGKTSLVVSYTTNGYPQEYVPTAFDNYSVLVRVDDQPVSLQLCDTAGQDEFDSLRPLCYPNTDIFLLCFSVVSPSSFVNLRDHWVSEVRRHSPGAPCLLVGTQCDLRSDIGVIMSLSKYSEEPVTEREAQDLAKQIGAVAYIECSALTQLRLKDVFDTAILAALNPSSAYLDLLSPDSPASARNSKILLEEYKGRKSFRRLKERLWQASVGRSSSSGVIPSSGLPVCPSPKAPARKNVMHKQSAESASSNRSPLPTRPPRLQQQQQQRQQQLKAPFNFHDNSNDASNNIRSNKHSSNNNNNYNSNNNNNINDNNNYNKNINNNNNNDYGSSSFMTNSNNSVIITSNGRVLTTSMTPPLTPKSPQIHPTRSEQSGLTDHWIGLVPPGNYPQTTTPGYHHQRGLESSPRLQKKSTSNSGIRQRWKKLFCGNMKAAKLPAT